MKKYNRIMLGSAGRFAKICRQENYIGCGFEVNQDLSAVISDDWEAFKENCVPILLRDSTYKTNVSAGVACGFLYTIVYRLKEGDVVLCPSGEGTYYVGVITGDYYFVPGTDLQHRRPVQWMDVVIPRNRMSQKLKNSTGSIGTCCDVTRYADEIESLIADKSYVPEAESPKADNVHHKGFDERSLHKLFCTYLRSREIFAKTIFHEKNSSRTDHAQKWVNPDIVGVRFEGFGNDATLSLLKATEPKESVHIYSFELKKKIDSDYLLKQYFFQALSNSSWANYGYLVAFEIDESLDEEMKRLNNAFGIGIIEMQATEAKMLYQAREKQLDYNTIEKLNNLSPDFRTFIAKLSKVMLASKDYTADARKSFESICDKVFDTDEEIAAYCKEHSIPY